MILASDYGREYFWIPVVAIMLAFGTRKTKILAIELATLFVVGIILGEALKYVIERPRPFQEISGITTRVPMSTDSSYPSGHALIVSIGAIFALLKFERKVISVLLGIEAALVCFSRVYVGMHYPLDVLSAIFLGGFIVSIGVFLIERYFRSPIHNLTSLIERILRINLFRV